MKPYIIKLTSYVHATGVLGMLSVVSKENLENFLEAAKYIEPTKEDFYLVLLPDLEHASLISAPLGYAEKSDEYTIINSMQLLSAIEKKYKSKQVTTTRHELAKEIAKDLAIHLNDASMSVLIKVVEAAQNGYFK